MVYIAIGFVASNIYENLSILTGFPFGRYHYSDALGIKLFLVPIVIAPAYLSAGYLAWTLSAVLLGLYENPRSRQDVSYQAFVASFLMVMWDLIMDPISSTDRHLWIWHDGGSYFGVPISNYMGWFLCVGTIFFLFSVYIGGSTASNRFGNNGRLSSSYWYQAAAMFALLGFARAILALSGSRETAADAAGQIWQIGQIYESMALVTAFTMWFVAILSALLISKRKAAPF
jgi:putative membrane protein